MMLRGRKGQEAVIERIDSNASDCEPEPVR
jgi:hypothetical protein